MISTTKIGTAISLGIGMLLGTGVAAPTLSTDAVRIDSRSSRFELQNFAFEVNPQTGMADIRLDYDYPAYRMFGDETYRDPGPRTATVPGLVYDPGRHAVIYQSGTTKATCAVQTDRQGPVQKGPHLRNTHACAVTARANHDSLDTYFEVRGR